MYSSQLLFLYIRATIQGTKFYQAYFTAPIICSFFLLSYIREVQLEKGVTSIAIRGEGQQFFVGTEAAQMYRFNYVDFKAELISTSHNSAVKDVAITL